jgi:hypothetical protein
MVDPDDAVLMLAKAIQDQDPQCYGDMLWILVKWHAGAVTCRPSFSVQKPQVGSPNA